MNASEPIRRHARLAPDVDAYVRADGRAITYAGLDRMVDAVAHRVVELGVGPRQVVVVGTSDPSVYLLVALALARLGVAFAPATHPQQPADAAFLDRSLLDAGYPRAIALDELWTDQLRSGGAIAPVACDPDGSATLMHCRTSGTTGEPRFTPVSHDLALRRLALRAFTLASIVGARGGAATRQACLLPLGSWFGFSTVLRVLWSGGTVLQAPVDLAAFGPWIVRSRVTYLVSSPIALQRVVERMPEVRAPNALDVIEVAGGALPAQVCEVTRRRLCANVVVAYGSTESGAAASAPAARIAGVPGAVGYPYLGVTVEIVDDDDRPVAAGQEGIVRIRSECNAATYVGNPEAAARVFRHGCVYPGDLGVLEADGLLRVLGRIGDVIDRGGVKVHPQAVEDAMREFADLRDVAVFAVKRDGGIPAVCAAVVPAGALDAGAFHATCRARLGSYAPDFIMHMQELPRNANGKVLREELARIAVEGSHAQQPLH